MQTAALSGRLTGHLEHGAKYQIILLYWKGEIPFCELKPFLFVIQMHGSAVFTEFHLTLQKVYKQFT